MTTFEKQQRIESIKGIIKARWFVIAIIVSLGLILKMGYFGGLWGNFFDIIKIVALGIIAFSLNFTYWLVINQPIEKISDFKLNVIAAMQVVADQLVYTFVYYYTGTIETIAFLLYYITILIASSLYKTKGIIITGFLAILLYTGTTLADYYHLVPHIYPLPGQVGWFGNLFMTRVKIVGFIFYTGAAIFFSIFLSALIRDRETGLRKQRDQLQSAKIDLETEKNKVVAVIKSLTDGLVMLDSDGRISLVNQVAKKFLNLADNQTILGKKLGQVDVPGIVELNRLLTAKDGLIQRAELKLPGQLDKTLEISTADALDADSHFIGKIIVLHDITREKAIDKIKSEFVSITAHQLRTPLTAIKWVFKSILDKDVGEISRQQEEILNKGYASNERVILLINDLLEVARIEEGRFIYKFAKINFTDMLAETLKKLAVLINDKKITVNLEKSDNANLVVAADKEKMEMALFNLVENALLYTPNDGSVKIVISADTLNKKMNFSVKDTGIGIPEENYGRIFSKFFRGESAIKIQTEGSGLGLFIVKNIIESHGGQIWFESAVGQGTTFYVDLPLAGK